MKLTRSLILCAAVAAISSCSSLTVDTETTVKAEQGVPGGEAVRVTTLDGKVTGIDSAAREVTLVSRYGEAFKVTAGPEVRNFNQIRIGDSLKISLKENLVVRMAKPGEKLHDESYATGSRTARGAKPGAKMTETVQYVGTITSIDAKKRKATLRFSDGSSGSFDVRPDIDLSKRHTGEKVLIRVTESLAVSMKKS